MMNDIITKLGYEPTMEAKMLVHNFHKRILGYKTIAGLSYEALSHFLLLVVAYWSSEHGFFIRTNKKQPEFIEWMPLKNCYNLL